MRPGFSTQAGEDRAFLKRVFVAAGIHVARERGSHPPQIANLAIDAFQGLGGARLDCGARFSGLSAKSKEGANLLKGESKILRAADEPDTHQGIHVVVSIP